MCRASFTTQSSSFKIQSVTLVSIACLLVGCASIVKNKETAEHAVEVFHSQLNSERYSEMYAQADEDFKKSANQEEFEKIVRAVHEKLGKVQSSNQVAWLAATTSDGLMVTLTYETEFAHGRATEQLVWHVRDGLATLYHYNVNSTDLVTQ